GNCGAVIAKKFEWKDANEGGVTVESLGVPGLLKVGSDVFAVAEAHCKKSDVSFTGIASRLLTTLNVNTPVEVLKDPKDAQFLEDGSADSKKKVDVSRPTTFVEGNDIYMLVGKCSRTAATNPNNDAEDCGLLLVKGNVSGDESIKGIQWSDTKSLPQTPFCKQHEYLTGLTGGGGSGVKIKDGTLVFPVEGTKKEGEKTVSLIVSSPKDTNSWKLSKGMSDGGCGDPSVVEWGEKEDKKLIMMTACADGRRRVYESGDKGESWTEALGTISRVWGNKQGEGAKAVRSGFITATIDGVNDKRNVMLVTLPVYPEVTEKGGNGKGKLHLWLTDNTHIVDIGPVSGKDDDAAASSLLYKSDGSGTNEKEELIALYEKKKDGGKPSPGMVSVLLTAQLQRVKEVLATWKKVDETVSKLCTTSSAEKDTSSGTAMPTNGLVGFLSGNFSNDTWRDEYLGVNATVKKKDEAAASTVTKEGAAKAEDGVKFTGAWAEWPVGEQGKNQPYHFANYNFTLVATVSIHNLPEGDTPIPLLGVKMNGDNNKVLLGLSYNKERKWQLSCGGGTNSQEHSSAWDKEKKYQVAIVLRNGTQGTAYVDGKSVCGYEACALENKDSEEVSHFYIGGGERTAGGAGNQEDVFVTVRNVLLYNRPLSAAEIGALNPNKVLIPPVVPENGQGTPSQSSSAGQSPSVPKLLNENEGAGGGSTSTSATSTVTNSGEESVNQLALRASPGGSKHVDVASSSDGDPRVGAEGGDAVQGDTPPKTPVDTTATADANAPTATNVAQVGPADTTEVAASSGANGETAGGTEVQGELNSQVRGVNATALSSSLVNVSQGNNTDAGTVCGSGLLPSLLLLGLWVFAAL
ncbi:putative trans-sialidase, partial [Trypanosoma cruzi]